MEILTENEDRITVGAPCVTNIFCATSATKIASIIYFEAQAHRDYTYIYRGGG